MITIKYLLLSLSITTACLVRTGPRPPALNLKFRPGAVVSYPEGKPGEAVKQQEEANVHDTTYHSPPLKLYTGNALNRMSCRLDGGEHSSAASFSGQATGNPTYFLREGRVITLEDLGLNRFKRSCNGFSPPLGSNVSINNYYQTAIERLGQTQDLRRRRDGALE